MVLIASIWLLHTYTCTCIILHITLHSMTLHYFYYITLRGFTKPQKTRNICWNMWKLLKNQIKILKTLAWPRMLSFRPPTLTLSAFEFVAWSPRLEVTPWKPSPLLSAFTTNLIETQSFGANDTGFYKGLPLFLNKNQKVAIPWLILLELIPCGHRRP